MQEVEIKSLELTKNHNLNCNVEWIPLWKLLLTTGNIISIIRKQIIPGWLKCQHIYAQCTLKNLFYQSFDNHGQGILSLLIFFMFPFSWIVPSWCCPSILQQLLRVDQIYDLVSQKFNSKLRQVNQTVTHLNIILVAFFIFKSVNLCLL